MDLSTKVLSRFVGGQAEIQNLTQSYIYRGEIESIVIAEDALVIRFAWCARDQSMPFGSGGWVKADDSVDLDTGGESDLDYRLHIELCSFSDTRQGRIIFDAIALVGEVLVLFPVGDNRLDPTKVEGLSTTPQEQQPTTSTTG